MTDRERAVVLRQADRYLMAAQQDTSPAYGLVHASYAMAGYEALTLDGMNVRDRVVAAAKQQDKWGLAIRKACGEPCHPDGTTPKPMLGLGAWVAPQNWRCFS